MRPKVCSTTAARATTAVAACGEEVRACLVVGAIDGAPLGTVGMDVGAATLTTIRKPAHIT